MDDAQDGDGFVVLGLVTQGVGYDVGQAAQDFFVGAGHAALAPRGCGGESLDGSIDTGGDVAGGGGIFLRDVADDAAKIVVGVF